MSKQIQITAEKVIEGLYLFTQQNSWILNKKEPLTALDPLAEKEAVAFLYSLSPSSESEWNQLSESVKNVVAGLYCDFMYKLLNPNSPFAKKTWTVSQNLSVTEQALMVIKQEIDRAHTGLTTVQ